MKIRLSDIPPAGRTFNDTFSCENLNARMNEGKGNDIIFLEAPVVEVTLTPRKGGIEVVGFARSTYQQPCGRCMENISHSVQAPLSLFLKPTPTAHTADEEESTAAWEDNIGIVFYSGEHIDLEEIVQESLILELSPFNLNHEACPGVAPGATDDEKITFRDLFKLVGLN